jgi:hypothetical protein
MGEPAGEADRLEEADGTGDGEDEHLEERMGDEHDAEREAQGQGAVGRGRRVDGCAGHERSPARHG